MGMQARCERLHVERAALVIATSRYSAERAQEFYGLKRTPTVVPELIDLAEWRRLLAASPPADKRCFTVLFVGRFYRRKRRGRPAAGRGDTARSHAPTGSASGGRRPMCRATLSSELKLDSVVTWLGDVSRSQLVSEYQRADLFCLPSVQEGFGIVLLEAMAAGKPIVAARAAAIPEVAPRRCAGRAGKPRGARRRHRRPVSLAGKNAPHSALHGWSNSTLHAWHGAFSTRSADCKGRKAPRRSPPASKAWVEQFNAPRLARRFLDAGGGLETPRRSRPASEACIARRKNTPHSALHGWSNLTRHACANLSRRGRQTVKKMGRPDALTSVPQLFPGVIGALHTMPGAALRDAITGY